MQSSHILVVDDDADILNAAKLFLKRHFGTVTIEQDPRRIPFLLNNYQFDIILLDMNFSRDQNSGMEGFSYLETILDLKPEQKVILFTAYGDIEMAVRAIKIGAKDFVLKPWENDKLLATLQAALEKQSGPTPKSSTAIIAESEAMKAVFKLVNQVAKTDATVLILGENGTGKDLIAKEIHQLSARSKQKFVHADLGSISENLFESELFGHIKGAFTDAKEERVGRFQEADKGTIFLDELGNIPYNLQGKLLYALQNKEVVKVGANKSIAFDARVIAATNANLQEMIAQKSFRQDLYFRINTIEIVLPPLREREGDVLLLAEHFLKVFNEKYNRKIKGFSAEFQKKLKAYTWPGNIRELQHVMERAVIVADSHTLGPELLQIQGQASEAVNSLKLEELEKNAVLKALKKFNGNITEAAKDLGLSRQAFYRRIEKFNL